MNWKKAIDSAKAFHCEEDGPTSVEYAVMIGLIIVACFSGVQAMATRTQESFIESADAINTAIGP